MRPNVGSEKTILAVDLGLMEYETAWEIQRSAFQLRQEGLISDLLLLVEHPPVYTLGTASDEDHLLIGEHDPLRARANVYHVERGGDVTFHGPGQIVGYPILDLTNHYQDLHRYLRDLEETILRTIGTFGIKGERDDKYTGVWVSGEKIAAIGVKVKRWVTMHGFALNVNTDLSYFDSIIPCGIFHKGVTSMKQILGREADFAPVREELLHQFAGVFSPTTPIVPKEPFLNHLASLAPEQKEWNVSTHLPQIS